MATIQIIEQLFTTLIYLLALLLTLRLLSFVVIFLNILHWFVLNCPQFKTDIVYKFYIAPCLGPTKSLNNASCIERFKLNLLPNPTKVNKIKISNFYLTPPSKLFDFADNNINTSTKEKFGYERSGHISQ